MTTNIFPFQYAFNLFSHNSSMTDNGYNEEEMKLVGGDKRGLGAMKGCVPRQSACPAAAATRGG